MFSYLQLKDATDTINIVISNFQGCIDEALIGKVIKVNIQKIVSEWSLICGKTWETTYIITNRQDIEFADINLPKISLIADRYGDENKTLQEWKVSR